MQVIPVIDLMDGHVVRAVRGERAAYRPIRSSLCPGSEPVAVARALLDYAAAHTLYLADLDGLTGGALQIRLLAKLLETFPETVFWLDGGFRDLETFQALTQRLGRAATRLVPVFGSESLASPQAARACLADRSAGILSLDRRDGLPLDPASCWATESLWPERLIVMTLERVGALAGPDLATFSEIRRRAPDAMLCGAGGIRDEADLAAAAAAGAQAWLVASALHDCRIGPRGPRA